MIKLILSKEIYNEKNIDLSIIAYKGCAKIKKENDEVNWVLLFSKCKYSKEVTIKEFENYLIVLENINYGNRID